MDGNPRKGNKVAALRNVGALNELIDRVQNRAPHLPGMACFHGPSGYGKSTAAAWNASEFDMHHVEVKSVWSRKDLCAAIVRELGLPPANTMTKMVGQIGEELLKTGRPLLIDDAHDIASESYIKIVKDIYESCHGTIILIGEETLPQQLAKWERIHGRMMDWIPAQPADLREVGLLAQIYCPGIQMDDKLHAHILKQSNASTRRICVNLESLHEQARRRGLTELTVADCDPSKFFTGSAPAPRRF